MFERFTDRARRVIVLAQEEARALSHDKIGAEHILLGLVIEGEGVAARALASLGITEETSRRQIEEMAGRGQAPHSGHLPFTPQAKKVLQMSLREALHLGHNAVGTEHVLLSLIRDAQSPGTRVLASLGADPARVRQQVLALLRAELGQRPPGTGYVTAAAGLAGRGKRTALLAAILARLDAMDLRLSALEHRVGAVPDVRDLDEEIVQVRLDKEAAIDAQEYERAATLRDREQQLVADKVSMERQWAAAHTDLPSLSDEVARLREVLNQHGIEPRDTVA
jgi:ATP-dependent Clp protease ATP-binding subunit ClpA